MDLETNKSRGQLARARSVARLVALLFSVALALPSLAAQEGKSESAATDTAVDPSRQSSWYTATIANDDSGSFLMVHFWSKGSLFRSEAVIAGRPIVTIVAKDTYYIYEGVSAQGVAIARSKRAMEQDASRGRPFANEVDELMRVGGELIGTEDSTAGPVDIFRATGERGRRTVWMTTKPPRVPLRVETFDRASGSTGKLDYVNWVYGPEIPDAFFAPDPRIKFERITYDQYRKRTGRETVGPAPVLYREMLHGHE